MAQRRIGRMAWVAAAVLLVALAACGDDETPTVGQPVPTDRPGTTATAATTTTAGAAVVRTANNDKFGTILVDSTGRSLYTFDRDTSTTSACTGGCATTWPPLLLPAGVTTPTATGASGTLATAPRPDGSGTQVAYNGKPLYRYAADNNPGDATGDGVGGNWHIAKP